MFGALQLDPLGVFARLLQQGVDQPVRQAAAAGAAQTGLGERLGDARTRPAGGAVEGAVVQQRRAGHVDDDAAHGDAGGAQLGDAVGGLLDRHLLQERHQMHRGLGRLEDAHHGLRLIVDRADLREAGDLVVDVQKAGDPAGRRGVHHDRVVDELSALVLAAHRFARLAGQQDVPQTRRDGRGEVDRAELLQRPARAAELVEHLEVVQKGAFGVDGQGVDLPARPSSGAAPGGLSRGLRPGEPHGDAPSDAGPTAILRSS